MKVVKILWVDSCNSNMNWTIAGDIEVEPMYIDSFGVIVKDTDEFLAIAQNYGDNPEQYSNITTIPKGCIKEIFVIHEDNVYKSEQKPADKVEPKFKVGDKIVENNEFGMVGGEITDIDVTHYELDGGGRYIPISHQDNYKLVEQKPVESQQDMLSQEQYSKAVDECIYGEKPVEWKQENVEELTDFENAMMHIGNSFFSANAGLDPNDTETVRSQANLLLELAQNPVEWSEEDESGLGDALWAIKQARTIAKDEKAKRYDESIERAKNTIEVNQTIPDIVECVESLFPELKENEDERIRKGIIEYLRQRLDRSPSIPAAIDSWIAWLEKQGEQKPAWSEEDKKMLGKCIDAASGYYSPEDKQSMKGWLNSLKERYTWKPSDEQMTALRRMKAAIAGEGEIYKPLNSLYKDLKKLREE